MKTSTPPAPSHQLRRAFSLLAVTWLLFTSSATAASFLINLDFGVRTNNFKTGPAALGLDLNDYWNLYHPVAPDGTLVNTGSLSNLFTADNFATPVGVHVSHVLGFDTNNTGDAMFDTYLYADDGSNLVVTVTGLPDGRYDFLVYGHGSDDLNHSLFELFSGTLSYGTLGTTVTADWNSINWAAGQQYVLYSQVVVTNGQPVTVNVLPNLGAYAVINGMQIVRGNAFPTVSMATPTDGSVVISGSDLLLGATAADVDGTISQVDFYANGSLVGTAMSAPYTFTWASAPPGVYSVTAVATDNQGAAVVSAPVTVTVGVPPSVTLTSPTEGEIITAGGDVTITAEATDSDGTITQVAFYSGTNLFAVLTNAPYAVNWTNMPAGQYTLRAVATDNAGLNTTSAPVSFVLNTPPTVNLTGLTNNMLINARGTVPLTATAADPDGTVAQVAFYSGQTLVGTTSTAPFLVPWSALTPGTNELTAMVTDNLGAMVTSAPITVRVASAPILDLAGMFERARPQVVTTNVLNAQFLGGEAAWAAVLINSTNFAEATWTNFSTNLVIELGTNDGLKVIRIALRDETGHETIYVRNVYLDSAPLAVVLSGLTNEVVATPILQLIGHTTRPIESISYDLINTNGALTNQEAFITQRTLHPSTREQATNWFQGFDLPLVNGTNGITVRAVDADGGVWTASRLVTLDLTQLTNPPVVTLIWPQDGALIAAPSATVRGTVSDPTVTVVATLTNAAGYSETIEGLVERDGTFWLDDVPLPGTNHMLSIVFTDAAGNVTTTNLNLTRSELTITFNEPTETELLQPALTLTGTINTSQHELWINGQQATLNGDGTWTAQGVRVNSGGMVSFHAVAIPSSGNNCADICGDGGAAPSVNCNSGSCSANGGGSGASSSPAGGVLTPVSVFSSNPAAPGAATAVGTFEAPARLLVDSYNLAVEYNHTIWNEDHYGIQQYVLNWADGSGGTSDMFLKSFVMGPPFGTTSETRKTDRIFTAWPATGLGIQTWDWYVLENNPDPTPDTPMSGTWTLLDVPPPAITPWEKSDSRVAGVQTLANGGTYTTLESRNANTIITLKTGGRSGVARNNLFTLTGRAWDKAGQDVRLDTPLPRQYDPPVSLPEILPPTSLKVGGMTLGTDGRRYRVFPDNASFDVTLTTPAAYKNYNFTVGQQKHKLSVKVNGEALAMHRYRPNTTNSVGQFLEFSYFFNPQVPGLREDITVHQWIFSGNWVNVSARRTHLGERRAG